MRQERTGILFLIFLQSVEGINVPHPGLDGETGFAARLRQPAAHPHGVVAQDLVPADEEQGWRQTFHLPEKRGNKGIGRGIGIEPGKEVKPFLRQRGIGVFVFGVGIGNAVREAAFKALVEAGFYAIDDVALDDAECELVIIGAGGSAIAIRKFLKV